MKIKDFAGWVTYVPEWMGNRELADGEQITVEIHPLTMEESSKYARMIRTKQVPGFRNMTSDNTTEIAKVQFCENCRNIQNLEYGDKQVTEPKDLWETPLTGLVNEITRAINDISELSEGEAKNSRSQPGGPSPDAGESAGAA